MAERHDPLAALRQPQFLLLAGSRFCSGLAVMALSAAVLWHVYDQTESALALGFVGLVRFVPGFLLSLPAGAIADSFDRKKLTAIALVVQLIAGSALAIAAVSGFDSLAFIYGAVFVAAIGSAFEAPARQP